MVWVLLLILFAGAASQFAVSLANWFCTLLVPPRPTMRLDFSAGIPAENRTLVAVPSMLSNAGGVRGLVEQMEHRYLANRDDNLFFVLLTDFPDAPRETMPDDRRLLILARTEIGRLNRRYRRSRPRSVLPSASAAEVESNSKAYGWARSGSGASWRR